ncbi:unnamed protein product [Rotaria socialis]|uniref:Fatty acyl-CoA reductase n=1 Tax=Rotaria socialis TaxID=392032 RepID=A0A820Q783_9BILA|nr:unnamed protein product [Rotaria socialis]CAF3353595.1 unnamed protein product [Rotaria socialis]CAF3397912.1 unnamed protein product [Rotaria socialis]CAF3460305.1 unnamed protein product [Rotaria socialis]CAF3692766.1 unnamed protein product [Rotaria socialis]
MSSSIPDFYHGKIILVFGSTTFPGKVLLEKLLRSCPDIEKIYCPVYPTKKTVTHHLSPVDTFTEIYTTKLFDRVRRINTKFQEKIIPFDINLLISPTAITNTELDSNEEKQLELISWRNLQNTVDLCFYIANNSVDFDEQNLKDMIQTNVMDLKSSLTFLKTCTQLQSIVYLSSIYANIDCPFIDECVYPCPIEPQKLVDALDWMDKEMVELATPKLIGPKPNAFAFSHWLAETVLSEEQKSLPSISIVRVSIIGAAWKDPYPGWVEKSNGPSELFAAVGRGYLRSMKGDSHDILDIVPVDIPVNLLIAASWERSCEERKQHLTLYHCTSSGLNPFHWQEMSNHFIEYSKRVPYEHAFRRPNLSVTSHSLIHDSYVFFSHLIPAYLADIGLRLTGRQARVVNLYKNLHRTLLGLESFMIRGEIQCSYDSLNSLRQLVSETNNFNEFNFDIRALHWPTYIESYLIGTKRYVLNEDMNSLNGAQKHLNNLRNIRWAFNTIILVLLWRIFISKRPTARNLWYFVINFFVAKFVRFFKILSAGNT